jgi:hypothetical protein
MAMPKPSWMWCVVGVIATARMALGAGDPANDFRRVSVLLGFESAVDGVFVRGADTAVVEGRGRNGSGALEVRRDVIVKVGSLLSGREWPGGWTVMGAWVRAEQGGSVSMSVKDGETVLARRVIKIGKGQWSPAMVDILETDQATTPDVAKMTLGIEFSGDGRCWVDDVQVADNSYAWVDNPKGGWGIRRKGFNVIVEQPAKFVLRLATEEVAGGWKVIEANPVRARFQNAEGKVGAVYADGRSYWDGVFRPLAAGIADVTGLRVAVDEDQGRLERNSPGDANHDGYNELEGAYRVVATDGARKLGVKLSPGDKSGAGAGAVLVVRGLAAGEVRVTVEGEMVRDVVRLADGSVMAVVPAAVERDLAVEYSVRGEVR